MILKYIECAKNQFSNGQYSLENASLDSKFGRQILQLMLNDCL